MEKLPNGESMVTVKWWAVMVVIICVFGWMFGAMMNHERRITIVETQYTQIYSALTELRDVTKEIRAEQIKRLERRP